MHIAAKYGHTDVLRHFVETEESDLSTKDNDGKTALDLANENESIAEEVVQMIIKASIKKADLLKIIAANQEEIAALKAELKELKYNCVTSDNSEDITQDFADDIPTDIAVNIA